jgi:hypothetical protein
MHDLNLPLDGEDPVMETDAQMALNSYNGGQSQDGTEEAVPNFKMLCANQYPAC